MDEEKQAASQHHQGYMPPYNGYGPAEAEQGTFLKILLLCCKGQVGWELHRSLSPIGLVTAIARQEENGLSGDLSDPKALSATIKSVSPDIIVNAAAYTAVDQAESKPEQSRRINAEAPVHLARMAKEADAWLIHFSTDYVFDGTGTTPWKESALKGPINVYGKTKLEGEEAIRESGCRHLIFRTSWVYSAACKNFIHTMLRLAAKRDRLRVIDDQIGAPTGAELIADVGAHVIRTAYYDKKLSGTYHLTAAGETSWNF
ncbi:dTDP-4-dehydrorhamnose reductase [Desulfosalsimonas propionicica]|uniref:dTDP-4-dehydrorhamnose reductase n=1 Tax=Desulfosalsimonas propionicica TaxID=332175 RepID=A0A7W0C973_9BACT|nr:dTDP-4-dehydrorhamnose reductase [Desulfosalsimonas propionicica]MBA2881488.1 dTDP-4-dehydrorhamnose reductase [Desulfosalsimonas propionicica]